MRTKLFGFIALLSIFALAGCGSSGNSNAGDQLSSLTILSGTLSPTFASGKADYTVSVDNSVTMVTVTPTAKDSGATITVNDVAVTSGAASGSIDLAVGDTTITIKVTGKDGKTTYTYTVTVTRAASVGGGLGDQCSCAGAGCNDSTTGVGLPAGGTITGCSNLLSDVSGGRALMCLRSFESTGTALSLGVPSLYFANGYCALGAAKCTHTGAIDLCSASPGSTFGDYDHMDPCPSGSVMISYSLDLTLLSVVVYTKACTKSCTLDTDCRNGETDPEFANATTHYQCIPKDGTKFCFDPRDLTGTYTAEAIP